MNNCSVHNTPLKPLFTSWYCPTCESPTKTAASTSSDWLFEGVWHRAWGEPEVAVNIDLSVPRAWIRAGWDSKDLNKVNFIKLDPNRKPNIFDSFDKDRYIISEKLADFIRNHKLTRKNTSFINDLALTRKT